MPSVLRSGNHQRQIERHHSLVAQQFGHIAVCNLLRQAFGDGRFADARFTDQHGVVFCPSAKHLNDTFNFIAATNHGIEFIFLREIREVAAKRTQGGGFDVFFCRFAAFLIGFRRREIWIQLFENFIARAFDIDF